MRPMVRKFVLFCCAMMCCAMVGCDPPPAAPASQPLPNDYRIEIDSLATLLPRKQTHLSLGIEGTIFYVQEQRGGDDVVFSIPRGGIAQPTPLTSRAIAEALGKRDGITGNIQSLAVDSNGRVVFFFAGGSRRTNTSCLGSFDPSTSTIRILIGSEQFAQASLMGGSIELARGSVVISGSNLWVILQHTAQAAVFRLRTSIVDDQAVQPVHPAFFSIRTPFGKLELTHDEMTFAPGRDGSLMITDRFSGGVWQVDRDADAALLQNLVGVPNAVATAGLDRSGQLAILINDGDPVPARLEGHTTPLDLDKALPIFLLKRNDLTMRMGRDSFTASAGFAIYAASLDRLLADVTGDHWIGYDTNSGELIRLRLLPVPGR